MNWFHMPADFKSETIDGYVRLHERYPDARVASTYGSLTVGSPFGSGRNVGTLPPVDDDALRRYTAYGAARGIGFGYTLNATYWHNREFTREGVQEIRAFLDRLHQAGVDTLIVTMPSLIELIRALDPRFTIKASVICQITNANKALLFKRMGVDRIVIDESLNRDFRALRSIRAVFGENVELIVNVVCHQDCHYRMFHYNQNSGDAIDVSNEASRGYFYNRCLARLYSSLGTALKTSWIRPEDLPHYTGLGIHHFKLQGRHTVLHGDPVRAAECYMRQRHDGDLKDLLLLFAPTTAYPLALDNRLLDGFLKPFYEHEGFCPHDCTRCTYCEDYARKCFDPARASATAHAVVQALREKDPLAPLLRDAAPPREGHISATQPAK